jgi:hypothetical protein
MDVPQPLMPGCHRARCLEAFFCFELTSGCNSEPSSSLNSHVAAAGLSAANPGAIDERQVAKKSGIR